MPIEPETDVPESARPHTGRRRNPAVHQAILDAAAALVSEPNGPPVAIETIAARAGVSKQTIYRWWPTKHAVLLEVLLRRARVDVSNPDTGTLRGDLTKFLTDTFLGASAEPTASLLRTVLAEAQRDANAAGMLSEFTGRRRDALREILSRGVAQGELSSDTDLDLIIDQAYGVLWYRLLVGHATLTEELANQLATGLANQAAGHKPPDR